MLISLTCKSVTYNIIALKLLTGCCHRWNSSNADCQLDLVLKLYLGHNRASCKASYKPNL